MVHISVIEARLSQLELRISRLFKPEINELQHILVESESIIGAVPGRYFGGFALLVATDRRVLLIDKKVAVLSIEDIRYDMISEVDYGVRLMDATLVLFTVNKQHRFTSYKHKHKLRELTNYVQQRVMELRYGPLQQEKEEDSQIEQTPALTTDTTILAEATYPPHRPNIATASSKTPGKLKHLVGAAALHDTPWSRVNPYTRTSLMVRSQLSHPATSAIEV